jgi:hypothetical protein
MWVKPDPETAVRRRRRIRRTENETFGGVASIRSVTR